MATWTNLPQANIEPEKPIRASDIWAIYQNILALAEGASGAPKILPAALKAAENLTAGTTICSTNKSVTVLAGSNIKGFSFIILGNGGLTFNTTLTANTSNIALTGRWYKNNVAIGSSFTSTNNQDFNVSQGDIFTLQVSATSSAIVGYGGAAMSYLSCNSLSSLLPLIAI
jgi:hypothetical protein